MTTAASAQNSFSSDLITRARIKHVWAALGGPPLRYRRGRAWWREGEGFNVAIDDDRGTWFDHAAATGGGILDLIGIARSCSRADAMAWLSDHVGVPLRQATPELRQRWQRERDDKSTAEWWARSARALAERLLEDCSDAERAAITRVAQIATGSGTALIDEYRAWRSAAPELTDAMVKAGANADRRRARALASLIVEWSRFGRAAA
jgi:hypothetical protein